jgi:D-alanyl-D-alanine carboxypeptidase (penicillin-binding protein 5/6)
LLALFLPLYLGWSWLAIPSSALSGAKVTGSSLQVPVGNGVPDLSWPTQGQAAVGTTAFGALATHGTQKSAPIASIAKVMTALAVLKEKPFKKGTQGATLKLTQADVDLYNEYVAKDGSVALVAAGEEISEYQALQALLLPSANNMADTLAIWVFGSVKNYTDYANDYAATVGLSQTRFADASGYEPGTVSSASDLVRLGTLALQNEIIADIVAQPSAMIPVAGRIRNVNHLVGTNGVIGIKTGNTDQAGGCLLFAAKHTVGTHQFIIVGAVMGEAHLYQALRSSAALLASTKKLFQAETVTPKNTVIATYRTPWGETSTARTDAGLEAISWNGGRVQQYSQLDTIGIPAAEGQTAGTYTAVSTSTQTRSSVPLRLDQAIHGPSLGWRLLHPVKTWQLKFS